jgi:patatin-like phospholipase/acyl hydrolase
MKNLKVLSLDGGGVRGYLTISILANIEIILNQDTKEYTPLGKYFDLIAGTSTGAIIAGLLAIGKSAVEVKDIYEKDMQEIFSDEMKNSKYNVFKSKYKKDNLIKKANEYFGDKTFKRDDLVVNLLITVVDITTASPRFYKSDYFSKNITRVDEKLSDAIVASVSAPTYFPVAKDMEYSSYLVDGGVVANNPSLVALIDAIKIKKEKEYDNIVLLSVGTGQVCEMPYDVEKLEDTQIGWISNNKAIIELLMNSQSKLAEYQTQFLAEELDVEYKRLNPSLGVSVALDDVSKIKVLKNLADIYEKDREWIIDNLKGENND